MAFTFHKFQNQGLRLSRAGYERPNLPQNIIDKGYTAKMARGLHNDADIQTNGEGLYYQNGKLSLGIHEPTLPDSNKPDVAALLPKPGKIRSSAPKNSNSARSNGEQEMAQTPASSLGKSPAKVSPSGGVPQKMGTTGQPRTTNGTSQNRPASSKPE
jgi:hypothetical protein